MAINIGDKLQLRLKGKRVIAEVIDIESSSAAKQYYGSSLTITVRLSETNTIYILQGINKSILGGVTRRHLENIPLDGGAWKMVVSQ